MTNTRDFIEIEYQRHRVAAKDLLRTTIDYYRSVFASEYAHRMLVRDAVRRYNADKSTARILRDVRLKDLLDAREAMKAKVIGDKKLEHSLVVYNAAKAKSDAAFVEIAWSRSQSGFDYATYDAARWRRREELLDAFRQIESDVPVVQFLVAETSWHHVETTVTVLELLIDTPFDGVLAHAHNAGYCTIFRDTIAHAVEEQHLPAAALDLADDYDWTYGGEDE